MLRWKSNHSNDFRLVAEKWNQDSGNILILDPFKTFSSVSRISGFDSIFLDPFKTLCSVSKISGFDFICFVVGTDVRRKNSEQSGKKMGYAKYRSSGLNKMGLLLNAPVEVRIIPMTSASWRESEIAFEEDLKAF
ncbi:hypothetical protein CEXT_576001 [Caerostris extrusa]|uniref:Uncharacterized protein n=1 Tax=Caerostris extrusa TaxID=172846 RepID=A0AAV4MWF2_CAEEX|nr:hypothetical protein CEXT_576001 [Caerostris extrusa]